MLPHDVVLLHCTYNQNKPCPRTSVKIAQRFWFWNQGGSRDPRARTRNREREGAVHTGGGVTCYSRCRNAGSVLQLQYFHPWNRNLAWRSLPQGATLLISGMQVQSCRKKYAEKKPEFMLSQLMLWQHIQDVLLRHPDAKCFAEGLLRFHGLKVNSSNH